MSDTPPQPALPASPSPEAARAHLDNLLARLPGGTVVYDCLRDLLDHGPIGTRGSPAVSRPSRSVITHYLAGWARSVGLSEEACLEWLTAYALGVLAGISKSSTGAIRHNTKGIVKYVYRSGYPFNCGKEDNVLRCRCNPQCPVYSQAPVPLPTPVAAPTVPAQGFIRVKDRYRERFEKSMLVIREMLAEGRKAVEIVERLNAEELPTKTGRKWTGPMMSQTLKSLR